MLAVLGLAALFFLIGDEVPDCTLTWGEFALNLFGCFRLGARIWELRNEGYPGRCVLSSTTENDLRSIIFPIGRLLCLKACMSKGA